ncbi:hypothetical protein [Antarctobacter heliothermus]|uniref:Lipoprotein n=1 Tax=Antarctobacter heliothermus TaxID=74033 RepID=A0A239ANH3_9RHOB|nr:hypothetical protein [Antarctobacter heliothermus]SNR97080.1 hypothetical protein SAMN04488078_100127 [Antarctobacter heliothermus]
MRQTWIAACACAALAAACAQTEETEVYVQPEFDKFGNVVNGAIIGDNFVLADGTIAGPVSPDVAAANRTQTRDLTQAQQQVQDQQQTQQQRRGN